MNIFHKIRTFRNSARRHNGKKEESKKNRIQRNIKFDQKRYTSTFPARIQDNSTAAATATETMSNRTSVRFTTLFCLYYTHTGLKHNTSSSLLHYKWAHTRHRRKFISRMFPVIRSQYAIAVLHSTFLLWFISYTECVCFYFVVVVVAAATCVRLLEYSYCWMLWSLLNVFYPLFASCRDIFIFHLYIIFYGSTPVIVIGTPLYSKKYICSCLRYIL